MSERLPVRDVCRAYFSFLYGELYLYVYNEVVAAQRLFQDLPVDSRCVSCKCQVWDGVSRDTVAYSCGGSGVVT